MAKIIKMNPAPKGNKDFQDFCKGLPQEMQEVLHTFGINSFTDLMGLSAMLGIDPEKVIEHDLKHPGQSIEDLPPVEEFMLDEDHPMYNNSIQNIYDYETDDDPFMLPERVFIGDKAMEYHIRIKLNKTSLPIWRELKVPSNITLEVFSFLIIEAMGWQNIHLHQFKKGDIYYKNTACINQDRELMPFGRVIAKDTNDFSLSQILVEKGDRMKFEYDFGDSWEHEIWVKGIREYAPGETPDVIVVEGKGACPPEDCGGVWGYDDLLRIHAKKRRSKEDKERLQWYHMHYREFNPEECNIEFAQEFVSALWDELTMQE